MVTPPSTKMKSLGPICTTSGGKYVGAAVLARTSRQSGSSRLQSGRAGSLYLAYGLLDTGQGESVVALRRTTMSRVRSLSEPSLVVGADHLLEHRSETAVVELVTKAAEQGRMIEHLAPFS